ncbi:hybrid sensor histidine kinase/response regulator [Sansalvadorimonas sp. 2012CJ34-2]|uniref:histidine kinase n=1 Tax=Parendozoicomonas callyspongiae TaxID=2942213 RepID=A0ABT0PGW5_9GAMM|nr:PAS domain-containing hybrid sensor histidine kinase/response regulator [Sansalvadorimonas sp. 2012CJ34-2]MCL6270618.1 hybrid sensor histidine kinase/response regulator [Sansalvadorimonas sp. 2012CJ34-2]
MAVWLIVLVSILYAGSLFTIAWYGDRSDRFRKGRWQPLIYSLTLAVYCTSWSFFGAVGQAVDSPWSFIPIYLAPIVLMLVFWRLQARMIAIGKRENITSIADFLAARYGRSRLIAIVATSVAVFGVIPYIALQLKAIVMGYSLFVTDQELFSGQGVASGDTALLVTLVLAAFSILFGTRHLDTTEHHHGVMLAIAVESVLKLLAFIAVGVATIWFMPDTFSPETMTTLAPPSAGEWANLTMLTVVSMMAYLCLPRQFHVSVVENEEVEHFHIARWVFSGYLLLMAAFVLPIALTGQELLSPGISPDTFVINLPMGFGSYSLAILAYVGGVSAAISMVIVSVITLAIMLGNEMVVPALLQGRKLDDKSFQELKWLLLNIRRSLIFIVLFLAWAFSRAIEGQTLASMGFMSFTALAQLAPGLIGGLLWRKSNSKGVVAGIIAGGALWFLLMVLPAAGVDVLPMSFTEALFAGNSQTARMLISLLANLFCYAVGSIYFVPSLHERDQAGRFLDVHLPGQTDLPLSNIRVDDLELLAARFVGEDKAKMTFEYAAGDEQPWFFRQRKASPELLAITERLLSSVLGTSSARIVIKSALKGQTMDLTDVEDIVGEASSVLTFNRELLQSSIENISQGVSVIDRDLRLVAWNRRYIEMFHYPETLVRYGRHISELILFNAHRGLCGPGDPEQHVRKRLNWLEKGSPHTSERQYPDGKVIQIQGSPMPGGGFVMSFSDITKFREAEDKLTRMNEELESRVSERTRELEKLNTALLKAKYQAEQANQSRSLFYTTISHDLMQPMHAARLFAATMADEFKEGRAGELATKLDGSLGVAEDLLKDLQQLSRLETGRVACNIEPFPLSDILASLETDFSVMAQKYQVKFHLVNSDQIIASDKVLLRRVLQNFLANAFRYAQSGSVMLICRRQGEQLRIEVRDSGPGIPKQKQEEVFKAFQRLDHSDAQGLGLGLAISRGIARLLKHDIGLRSVEGKGSVFSITVARAELPAYRPPVKKVISPGNHLAGCVVFCIDNDEMILEGLSALLQRWQAIPLTARNMKEALTLAESEEPDIILADYHLDHGENGHSVARAVEAQLERDVPVIVISADASPMLKAQLKAEGVGYLAKPVKPAGLRALMQRMLVVATV